MFGPEHAGHFFEVGTVALFLYAAWERHRYDPLCDVHQVHLIVLLHCLDQTHTPARQRTKREKGEKVTHSMETPTVDKLGRKSANML